MTKRRAPLKRKKPLFSHHKHSGKRLPHHHTGYLPLLFVLLFAGLFMAGISRTARASADIVVLAKVPAELPPYGAVIAAPIDGVTFDAIPIDVQGTCPAGYLIKLYRNTFFSGSVLCAPNGTFSMQSDLFTGSNELIAHVFNITDDEGPLSPAVTVQYTPSVPPAAIEPTSEGEVPATPNKEVPQFILKAENIYKSYIVGQEIAWELEVVGGTAPYAFSVDWGDGKSTVISRKQEGKFTVTHTYDAPGGFNGSFTIRVSGSDGAGQKIFTQLIVIVNAPFSISSHTGKTTTRGGVQLNDTNVQTIAWVTYSSVVVVVGTFWLGGQWQYRHLLHQFKLPKHGPHHA